MARQRYRLVLRGELSDAATAAFGSTPVTSEAGNTILLARDQAEMLAFLQRASDLGMHVLSASESPEPPAAA